ncbi:MAG: DUF2437 domain-containing protein [Gemmatimonadetes bacterium]|nr:DUF2437 domain-containing protein [Gemmatimonadota bacterium]
MPRSIPALLALVLLGAPLVAQQGVTRYVRYAHEGRTAYGILEGETIRELAGSMFEAPRPTTTCWCKRA